MAELALISGMAAPSLQAILERLAREGAIEQPPAAAQEPPEAASGPTTPAATHRQLFETKLHPLGQEEREALAVRAVEPELSAFCFDPTPRVVRAVLENPRMGLPHARLIAAHHANGVGLDALGEKAALLQDAEVQRLLLRNPQTRSASAPALLSRRRLAEVYQTTQSRELPERNRRTAVEALCGGALPRRRPRSASSSSCAPRAAPCPPWRGCLSTAVPPPCFARERSPPCCWSRTWPVGRPPRRR